MWSSFPSLICTGFRFDKSPAFQGVHGVAGEVARRSLACISRPRSRGLRPVSEAFEIDDRHRENFIGDQIVVGGCGAGGGGRIGAGNTGSVAAIFAWGMNR